MSTNDSLRQTLEYFLQQKEKKLEEARRLEALIREIRVQLGEEVGEADEVSTLLETTLEQKRVSEKEPEIRVDEFLGLSQSEAAKRYLKKIGHAVSVEQLVAVLRKGACKVGGIDPKKTLYISLVRNVREFVPVQSGYIGLREFYPHLKAGTTNKNNKPKIRKSRRKRKRQGKIATQPKGTEGAP